MNDQLETTPPAPAPRRARHLMDMDAPRPVADRTAEKRRLTNVQRWIMSTLVVSTILHMSLALILLTQVVENPQRGAAEGLCVIAGILGVLAVVAARLIHGRSPLTWWLLLGVTPTLLGLWYIN